MLVHVLVKMADGTLQEVLDFLQKILNSDIEVIENFRKEKVDKDAVSAMTEKDLDEMGLQAKGDRAKLRAFCRREDVKQESEREAKLKKLKEIVQQGRSSRSSAKPTQKKNQLPSEPQRALKPTLKFEFRWKHYIEGSGYKLKRAQQGGGVRVKAIPRCSTVEYCLQEAENLFFPAGKSFEGRLEDMNIYLADFKGDVLDLWDSFSAEDYKEKYGFHTPRLFLLSKNKEVHVITPSSDESGDDELATHAWLLSTEDNKLPVSLATDDHQESSTHGSPMGTSDEHTELNDQVKRSYMNEASLAAEKAKQQVDSELSENLTIDDRHQDPTHYGSLIGTSDERKELIDQIERDYEASLAADKAKQQQRQIEKNVTARKEELRTSRERRAPPEPAKYDPHITISVRHPDLGVISRDFTPDCKLLGVYDWVGSLASSPEHFSLSQALPLFILYPDENASCVASSMLYMLTREDPVPLSQDEKEVEFYSGREENGRDNTLPIQEVQMGSSIGDNDVPQESPDLIGDIQIPSFPPTQLMEEDVVLSAEEQNALELIERLQIKRRKIEGQLQEHALTEVSRHNCFKDLLALYKQDNIMQSKLPLVFKGEDAVGDGVRREVYAVFWDSFVTNYCEGVTQFGFIVSPIITQADYVALGRILTHQFIQTGTIPLQLSEATIQQAVVGSVSEECLLQSFFMLLHEKEREVLQKALLGRQPFPTSELIDILSDFNIGTVPKPHNIRQILLQVSITELISKPFVCIIKLKEGMGSFWDDVSAHEIDALYSCCTPTTRNVVNSLNFTTSTPQEEKVSRWLVRYLKSQDHKILSRFLRFCTGSDLVHYDKSIKVKMEIMSDLAMRPKAQICFGILTVPKNCRSYAHFSGNIDFYMHNPHMWELNDTVI